MFYKLLGKAEKYGHLLNRLENLVLAQEVVTMLINTGSQSE